jgi:hypothetical protein
MTIAAAFAQRFLMVDIFSSKRGLAVSLFHSPPRPLASSIVRHLVWASLVFAPMLVSFSFRAAWHKKIPIARDPRNRKNSQPHQQESSTRRQAGF